MYGGSGRGDPHTIKLTTIWARMWKAPPPITARSYQRFRSATKHVHPTTPTLLRCGPYFPALGDHLCSLSTAAFLHLLCDPTTKRYAAMGVGNLATNLGNQEKIINEGALQPLISLAGRDNGDLESQRYAVFALTNVAATRSNHARLIGAGVCELVAALLEADDVEIRNSAAFCVGNFASNPDNHPTLLDEGVLGPLINLVASSDPQVGSRREILRFYWTFTLTCRNVTVVARRSYAADPSRL